MCAFVGLKCNTLGYATTNECYNEQFLSIQSGNYNEHMLQRRRRNTIGQRSMRVRMTCRAFPRGVVTVTPLHPPLCDSFMIFIREGLFIVFTEVRLFMLFKFTCQWIKF